jgi:hypothetical protein
VERTTRKRLLASVMFGACMAFAQVIIAVIHAGWTRNAAEFVASRAPPAFLVGTVLSFLLEFGRSKSKSN